MKKCFRILLMVSFSSIVLGSLLYGQGPIVTPTNEWVSFWGDTIKNSGYPVSVGTVVRAYDPQGILCGEFTVTTAGKYGLMAVYRDDALTTPDEGAQPGDTIRFTINGLPAVVLGPGAPVWTVNGAVIKLNMKIGVNPVLPPAPVAYSAYSILATQFSAQWSYVSTATGYRLDVALDSLFVNCVPGYQDKDAGTSTSWMVTGLQPRTKYFYRARAVNITGAGPNSNVISVVTDQAVTPTNEWVSFWGDTLKNSGYPVTVGTVVRAYDPQGILCGEFTVTTAGKYGLMSVYRDDGLTTPDEGAQPGDTIRFTINGLPAVVLGPGTPVWSSNGAVVKLNISSPTTGILVELGVPQDYSLSQNYPSPFNPTTTIQYALPKSGRVTLRVYDISGKKVATLIDGEIEAGYHSVEWNASRVASGIYFYRINAGSFSATKRLMLLR